MTLTEIETLLSAGRIFVRMQNGNAWRLRRNGATKTWKTRPGHFRIPVKAGLRACTDITHGDLVEDVHGNRTLSPAYYEIR